MVRTKIDETSYWPYIYYNANTIYILFMSTTYILWVFKARLDEAKKATQVRPEMIRAEAVTTTEAALDQAEPSGDTPGTN